MIQGEQKGEIPCWAYNLPTFVAHIIMCVCMCVQIMEGAYQFIRGSAGLVKEFNGTVLHYTNFKDILSHTNTFLRLHLKLFKFEGYSIFVYNFA